MTRDREPEIGTHDWSMAFRAAWAQFVDHLKVWDADRARLKATAERSRGTPADWHGAVIEDDDDDH